jgi:mannosyltransferase OCH1-like enzyme
VYSWQHKGSSYYLPQDTKPVGEESFKEEYINRDFMEHTSGENYPHSDEIDVMKYYNNTPKHIDHNRIVSSKKDILGLIWLTKIKLK